MRKSLVGIFAIAIASVFISACSNDTKQGEAVVSTAENIGDNSENETEAATGLTSEYTGQEINSVDVADGQGCYIDDEGNIHYFDVRPPTVSYNGHEYMQDGDPWWNMDGDWLNENYTYLGDAEYYSDYAPIEGRGDFTTNIDKDGCKIYQCNEENTYLFTLWSDGVVRLFFQSDLTEEEMESASAATDWKK